MRTVKQSGRLIGALFFAVMLTWGIGMALIHPMIDSPDYLSQIYPNKIKLSIGVLFELIEAAMVLAIAFLLYPIFRKYSEPLAQAYIGYRVIETMMLVAGILSALLLITISREYIAAGAADTTHYETWGIVLKDLRLNWSLYILALFHPLAALPFYFFLYKTKLVPRFLSSWGFVAAAWLVLDEVILESFGLGLARWNDTPIAGIAMGLNEIALGVWLVIKGFDEKREYAREQ